MVSDFEEFIVLSAVLGGTWTVGKGVKLRLSGSKYSCILSMVVAVVGSDKIVLLSWVGCLI